MFAREGEGFFWTCLIEIGVINTHHRCFIRFLYKNNIWYPGGLFHLFYKVSLYKVSYELQAALAFLYNWVLLRYSSHFAFESTARRSQAISGEIPAYWPRSKKRGRHTHKGSWRVLSWLVRQISAIWIVFSRSPLIWIGKSSSSGSDLLNYSFISLVRTLSSS